MTVKRKRITTELRNTQSNAVYWQYNV